MYRTLGSLATAVAVLVALVPAYWFAVGLGMMGVAVGAVAIVLIDRVDDKVDGLAEQLQARVDGNPAGRGGDGGDG